MNPHPRPRLIARLAFVLACGCSTLLADTVTLKDGTTIEGIIVMQTDTKLVLKQGETTRVIRADDVKSTTKTEHPVPNPGRPRVGVVVRGTTFPPSGSSASFDPWKSETDPIANATVKVFTTLSLPDVRKPWARLPPREETGSGFACVGYGTKYILTSAHLVDYATDIQIRGNNEGDKIPARIAGIDRSMDLAVLKLDDETFFRSHPAQKPSIAVLNPGTVVRVFGYSGESTNVTIFNPSVVTVDFAPYDAKVSGLNVVGIACCRKFGGQTQSYVIPGQELVAFLRGVLKESPYTGKPMVYDQTQRLENPALREYLGLRSNRHGVVVSLSATKDGSSLRDWDVLTEIMGDKIDDQGTVQWDPFDNRRDDHALGGGVSPGHPGREESPDADPRPRRSGSVVFRVRTDCLFNGHLAADLVYLFNQ